MDRDWSEHCLGGLKPRRSPAIVGCDERVTLYSPGGVDQMEFRRQLLSLQVRQETLRHIEIHVRQLYQGVKPFNDAIRQAKAETRGTKNTSFLIAEKLNPAVVWLLATQGCRHCVFSVIFEDPDLFESHRVAIEKGEILGVKVVAGISLDISFSNLNPSEVVTAALAALKPTRFEPS
jgi:hypothetical protein